MKKSKKLLFIFILLSCFTLNVKALPEDETKDNNEKNNQTETKSSDATLKDVFINNEKVVCSDYVCEKIIKDNDVSDVSITYKTNDSKASVSVLKIEETLKNGLNEYKVSVTAEDGTVKEYVFKVVKEVLSTDSSLKKIVVNGTTITLKSGITKYETTVSYASKKIDIEVEPNSSKAKVDNFKNNKASYDFFDNEKEIKIKVISEAGDVTTYVLNVSKREEKATTLKQLTIKNVKLNFESGITDYELSVLKSVDKLEITAVPTDQNAKIAIEGADKLEIGENTVKILVENDENTKTYTLKVKRLESEDKSLANLKSLTIEKYKLDFDENKYEYNLEIGDDNYLVIDAVPDVETSKVEITGNLDLVDGSIIKIRVEYDDDNYNIYKINIIKKEVVNKENNFNKIVILIVIALILTAIIVLLIIQIKNKKNKNKTNASDKNTKEKDTKEVKQEDTNLETKNNNIITLSDDEEIEDII